MAKRDQPGQLRAPSASPLILAPFSCCLSWLRPSTFTPIALIDLGVSYMPQQQQHRAKFLIVASLLREQAESTGRAIKEPRAENVESGITSQENQKIQGVRTERSESKQPATGPRPSRWRFVVKLWLEVETKPRIKLHTENCYVKSYKFCKLIYGRKLLKFIYCKLIKLSFQVCFDHLAS